MDNKKKHSKLFYQYLFSYVLMLLLPLIVISLFIYSYVMDILKEEIYVNNINTLQKAQNTIEVQLQNITSTEHRVYLTNVLEGFLLQNDTIIAINTKKELEKYCQMNPFLVDIAYYQEADDYIIAASSSCRKADFWNKMYCWENWGFQEFKEDLKVQEGFFFVESQLVRVKQGSTKQLVCLVIPLDYFGKRCVLMLLEEAFFTDLMPQVDGRAEVSAIVDANGRIVINSGESALVNAVYDENFEDKNSNVITIQGEKYLRSRVYSENYHWTYESLVRISGIEKKIVYIRLFMMLVCLFVCVGGGVGIVYFMKRNYIPIQTLEIVSNKILKNEENRNEIDHVRTVLNYLERQNKKLEAEAQNTNYAIKDQLVFRWLSGMYESRSQLTSHALKAGIELNKDYYQAALIHCSKDIDGREQEIEKILMESAPEKVSVVIGMRTDTESIRMIIGFSEKEKSVIEKYYTDCIGHLTEAYGLKCGLVLGGVVNDCLQLTQSYKEVLKALEYCVVMDDVQIIHYEETISWVGNEVLDIQPKRLETYIRNRDMEGLERFLHMTLQEMKNRKIDIRQVRMLCNEFIYSLERVISDLNRDYFIESPLYDNISGILQYDTVRELFELIKLVSNDIISNLDAIENKGMLEKLISYITSNCYEANFSTTSMAEEFQMSLPYLSRYFKKHMGKNLSDYVTELKMEKAKELLRYEGMAVREVAEAIGYYSVNSFNRRFKQVTGYTPGEYRDNVEKSDNLP